MDVTCNKCGRPIADHESAYCGRGGNFILCQRCKYPPGFRILPWLPLGLACAVALMLLGQFRTGEPASELVDFRHGWAGVLGSLFGILVLGGILAALIALVWTRIIGKVMPELVRRFVTAKTQKADNIAGEGLMIRLRRHQQLIAPLMILFVAGAVLAPVFYPVWTERWTERRMLRQDVATQLDTSIRQSIQRRSWLISAPPRPQGFVADGARLKFVSIDGYSVGIEYGRMLVECGTIVFVLGALGTAGWVYGKSRRGDAKK